MSKLDITIYDLLGEKDDSGYVLVDAKKINNYINLAKALEAEHEALKRDLDRQLKINRELRPYMETLQAENEALKCDIARYFETRNHLKTILPTANDITEFWALEEKLSKVGKEE